MENNKRPTQCQRIIKFIEDFGSITTLDAFLQLGVCRLASRICELRKQGYEIKDKQEFVLNRYGEKCYIKRYYIDEGKNDRIPNCTKPVEQRKGDCYGRL